MTAARLALLLLLCACGKAAPLDAPFASAGRIPNLRSLRVEQHGAVVREQYWGGGDANTPHDVRSVTKTVMSLLVGIAAQQGCLSLDSTLGGTLLSEAPADPRKAAITIRELLTMSAGFAWDELANIDEYNQWVLSPDPVQYVLARPLVTTPGSSFSYSSAGFHLISVALTNECGPTEDFAQAHLFDALSISRPAWERFDSPPAANGGAGLQLTTRDLAALGELVLHGGSAGGAQLVPSAYLTAATTAQIADGEASDFGPGYGYGLWLGDNGSDRYVMAQGYGGQFIFVEPQKDLVVVATSDWIGLSATAPQTFDTVYDLIAKQVLPLQ
jgi:CubicO group peptidase (beta-lactamase class C family)